MHGRNLRARTGEGVRPCLQQGFLLRLQPERINPGDKVNTLTTIKKITSGSTPEVANVVDALYGSIVTAGTWKASSLKVAEAAKVIENSQRDLNIAFVNELSIIFARLGIDTLEVLEAAGSKWNFLPFRPGMVGGHCIGVDPYYLTHKAEEVGYNPQVILAGRRINDNMARYSARNVIRLMLKNGIDVPRSTVGVMGVTFKENCPDIRNSKIIDLIRELQEWGAKVVVDDAWADHEEVERELRDQARGDHSGQPGGLPCCRCRSPRISFDVSVGLAEALPRRETGSGGYQVPFDRHKAKEQGFTLFRL